DILSLALLFLATCFIALLLNDSGDARLYPMLAITLLTTTLLFLNFAYTNGESSQAFREGAGIAFTCGAIVISGYYLAETYWNRVAADERQYMYWELAD